MRSEFVVVEFDNEGKIGTDGATFPFRGNFVDRAFLVEDIESLTPMFGVVINHYGCFDTNAVAYLHMTKIPILLTIDEV
jgi:hypothetical protein